MILIIGIIFFLGLLIFILLGAVQENFLKNDIVSSFCEEHGFTNNHHITGKSGFCYKEANGYLEKLNYFIVQENTGNRVLIVNE